MAEQPMSGAIRGVGMLDLSHVTWAEELDRISSISDVGAIIIPENLSGALARIPMKDVGVVIPVPTDAHLNVHSGALTVGGDGLADPGSNEILVVIGALIITSPVTRVGYREIIVTGLVLAPRGSEAALGPALTRTTGAVVYYRPAEGQDFRSLTGEQTLGGESLANRGGTPDDVLMVAGRVIVTDPVREVGFQKLIYSGLLVLPRESEAVLAPVLTGSGQLAWYDGRPRFFTGDQTFSKAFFELLDEPIAIALVGSVRIDDDVPPDLLREKITEITLVGDLTAPKRLIPVLQLLTTAKYGEFKVADDADAG
ncbi:MAG TPA: hypothetical protein VIL34_14180 [Actinopolymorphaceae bacterium]|jgi:hypothetical protein